MTKQHSHRFVEEYDGLVGFGLNREVDEYTLTYYLQKFSDDELMALIRPRLTETEMEQLFDLIALGHVCTKTDKNHRIYSIGFFQKLLRFI